MNIYYVWGDLLGRVRDTKMKRIVNTRFRRLIRWYNDWQRLK